MTVNTGAKETSGNVIPVEGKAPQVISYRSEAFRDRIEAGQLLGQELKHLRGKNAVVLGIPRGGIVIANEIARLLEADLDIILSRKLRTPGHPELAMGAIAEDGRVFLNSALIKELGIDDVAIQREKEYQLAEIGRRAELIRRVLPRASLENKTVIITDDGVATGATTQTALWAARREHPAKLVLAVPVGSEEAIERLAGEADETIVLRMPPMFFAVGQFYHQFEQVGDEEVLAILDAEARRRLSK